MTMDTYPLSSAAGIAETTGTVRLVTGEIASDCGGSRGSGGPGARLSTDKGPDFSHWPLPMGRVEVRHGLTYVHSAEPGGFSVEEYRRIPDRGRIELLDGVVVVHPEPSEGRKRLARHFYDLLAGGGLERFQVYMGPMDVVVGRASVFAPDVVVWPVGNGPPALVVEMWEDHGANYRREERRAKFSGYTRARVGAYWVVNPVVPTVTVYELGVSEVGFVPGEEVRTMGRRGWLGVG